MPWDWLTVEAIGTGTTSLSATLMYWNYGLRADLRAEREYSQSQEKRNQELNKLYQDLAIRNIETMTKMESAFSARAVS